MRPRSGKIRSEPARSSSGAGAGEAERGGGARARAEGRDLWSWGGMKWAKVTLHREAGRNRERRTDMRL